MRLRLISCCAPLPLSIYRSLFLCMGGCTRHILSSHIQNDVPSHPHREGQQLLTQYDLFLPLLFPIHPLVLLSKNHILILLLLTLILFLLRPFTHSHSPRYDRDETGSWSQKHTLRHTSCYDEVEQDDAIRHVGYICTYMDR